MDFLIKGKSFNAVDHNLDQDGDIIKILGKSHALFKNIQNQDILYIINISLVYY